MKRTTLFGLATLLLVPSVKAQDESSVQKEIERAREVIAKYVDTRQEIAREENEWKAYQELTERRIRLYEQEIANLEQTIEKAENETTQAEREIAGVKDEISTLRGASQVVAASLPAFEDRLRLINAYLPSPLKSKIARMVEQLGKGRQASDRMAIVIGILNEIDKFNSEFNFDQIEKKLSTGETKLVDVIYVGLSSAFYADPEGEIGGYGKPADGEWQWTESNDLAPAILSSILYYNGDIKPASLVNLPVEILDLKISN